MDEFPTAPVVAAGLIGGFAVARASGRRELGGGVLALAGAWCGRSWARSSGPAVATGLGVTYAAAFGASHPLAKRIGAWPAVLTASVVATAAAHLLADRG